MKARPFVGLAGDNDALAAGGTKIVGRQIGALRGIGAVDFLQRADELEIQHVAAAMSVHPADDVRQAVEMHGDGAISCAKIHRVVVGGAAHDRTSVVNRQLAGAALSSG